MNTENIIYCYKRPKNIFLTWMNKASLLLERTDCDRDIQPLIFSADKRHDILFYPFDKRFSKKLSRYFKYQNFLNVCEENSYYLMTREIDFDISIDEDKNLKKIYRKYRNNTTKWKKSVSRQFMACPQCNHKDDIFHFNVFKNKKTEKLFQEIKETNFGFYDELISGYYDDILESKKIFKEDKLRCPCCNYESDKEYLEFVGENYSGDYLQDFIIYDNKDKISAVFYMTNYINAGNGIKFRKKKFKITINWKTGQSYFIGPWYTEQNNCFIKSSHFVFSNCNYGNLELEKNVDNLILEDGIIFQKFQKELLKTVIEKKLNEIDFNKELEKNQLLFFKKNTEKYIEDFFNDKSLVHNQKDAGKNMDNFLNKIDFDTNQKIYFVKNLQKVFLFNRCPIIYLQDPDYLNFNLNNLEQIKNMISEDYNFIEARFYKYRLNKITEHLKRSSNINKEQLFLKIMKPIKGKTGKKTKKIIYSNMNNYLNYKIFKSSGMKNIDYFQRWIADDFNFILLLENKEFVKLCILFYGESKCFSIFSEMQSAVKEKNFSIIKDTFDMFNDLKVKNYVFERTDFNGNLKEIHDRFSLFLFRIKKDNFAITYNEKELKLNSIIGKYCFSVARDTYQLHEIGMQMKICVGGYDSKALKKECTIIYMKQNEKYCGCIELKNNELVQAKAFGNGVLQNEDAIVFKEWVKIKSINTSKCRDFDRIEINLQQKNNI